MSCQKCGGEHSTMECDDEIQRPSRMSESSFSAPSGYAAMVATVKALEQRVSELEKHSHPPVNLRPAVEAIVEECLSRHIDKGDSR